MSKVSDDVLGSTLLRLGHITPEKLKAAKAHVREKGKGASLGSTLTQMGYVNTGQLHMALAAIENEGNRAANAEKQAPTALNSIISNNKEAHRTSIELATVAAELRAELKEK